MKIFSDKIPDEKNDILGRKEFAVEISKALIAYSKRNTDGITISITGEWGSGKSTLLDYLKNELQNNKDSIKVIEFNPWTFYKEGNIREAFLIHFALALKDFETRTTSISKKVKNFVSAFRFLKNINAIAGNAQEGIEKAFEYFAKNDSIPELKEEIEKALRKSKKKIFILIDDVDRLTQSEILELLQVISLVMNFSNVYYIIAFDKEIVINAINKEYGNRGQDYLEKVIQVDYSLPVIRKEKLETLFFQMLSQLTNDYNIRFDDFDRVMIKSLWGYHGLTDFFTTIRDFKRFFNSLSFRLPLVVDEVSLIDFLAIEAIRLFDNDSYNRFYIHYSNNLRKRDVPEAIFKEDQLKQFKQPASDIIKAIFPRSSLDSIRGDSKRIYDPAYFERYFSLLRNENDISEKDFREFMERSEARISILSDTIKYDREKNLLERLNDNAVAKHFPRYDYGLIEAIINFYSNNAVEFEKHADKISDAIINLICSTKKHDEYLKKFFTSFKRNKSHPTIIHIYFFHYIRLFKKENRGFGRHHEFDEYYKKNFDQIYNWYIDTFKTTAFSLLTPRYTIECPFIKYLYLLNYAELFISDYLIYQKELFNDKEFLLYLLSDMIKLNDNLSVFRYDFRDKDLLFPDDTFLEFYNAIKRLDKLDFDERKQAYIDNFLKLDISNYPQIIVPDE